MFETSSESPAPVRVVTEAIKDYVDRLGAIWIEGEISELNERSGGMAFMRLRDTSVDMSISVMCHKSVLSSVSPLPQNARVVMYAKASWYTKNGSLTLSAREIRQVGIGEACVAEAVSEFIFRVNGKVDVGAGVKTVVIVFCRPSGIQMILVDG